MFYSYFCNMKHILSHHFCETYKAVKKKWLMRKTDWITFVTSGIDQYVCISYPELWYPFEGLNWLSYRVLLWNKMFNGREVFRCNFTNFILNIHEKQIVSAYIIQIIAFHFDITKLMVSSDCRKKEKRCTRKTKRKN